MSEGRVVSQHLLKNITRSGGKLYVLLHSDVVSQRSIKNTLPPFFIESWIYSSALSVVDQADEWAKKLTLDKAALSSFNSAKAELLELARHQVCTYPRL